MAINSSDTQIYQKLSDLLLTDVEILCDENDLDYERAGNLISILFEDESQPHVVINKQEPLLEVWLASRLQGLHFRYDATKKQWICTRTHIEFFEALVDACKAHGFSLEL